MQGFQVWEPFLSAAADHNDDNNKKEGENAEKQERDESAFLFLTYHHYYPELIIDICFYAWKTKNHKNGTSIHPYFCSKYMSKAKKQL